MKSKLFDAMFLFLSIAVWFNGVSFQLGRASLRVEHFLVFSVFFLEFCFPNSHMKPRKLNMLFLAWLSLGMITTFIGTIDKYRGLWIQIQYVIGLLILSSREFVPLGKKPIVIQARIGILVSIIYLLSYLYTPLAKLLRIGEVKEVFDGYSLEPNLLGSQALLLWILLYVGRDLLSKFERLGIFLLPILIVLSLTRAVWLAFIMVLGLFLIQRIRSLAAYFVLLIICLLPILFDFLRRRVTSTEDVYWNLMNFINFESGTAQYRKNVYFQALTEMNDTWFHFLLGHGFASFPELYPLDSSGVTGAYLSNAFVGILFETGILGTLLFLLLIGRYVHKSKARIEILFYVLALVTVSLTTSPLWLVFPWFYLKILGELPKRIDSKQ